jgi:ribosomal protein L37AE/L43A
MFIVGVLLGPFGILIALFSQGNRKTCPHCRELIHKDATVCSHCQRDLVAKAVPPRVVLAATALPVVATPPPTKPEPAVDATMPCPLCGKNLWIGTLKRGENYCRHCFKKFIAE